MAQSLASILVHIVFSTKERRPIIPGDQADELHAYLATACRSCGCPALGVGGTEDHVHLLVSLGRTTTVSGLLERVKSDSSRWMNSRPDRQCGSFHWQGGYGAFSVGQSQVETVQTYIASQPEHHATVSFQDEFRALLQRYGIEWDERYVWA